MPATPSHSCLTRAAGDRAHLAPLINQRRWRLEVAVAAALLVFFGRPTPPATRYTRLFLRELRDVDYRTKILSCSICGADGALALEEPWTAPPGKDGDSSVAPRRVHRWPCNHSWPRELMQDQPSEKSNDQDFCHCSCMRGFCGLDGPGPDVWFGRCGCVGRRRQDGHGHHWRQLCRHAPRLDWRRRFGRRKRPHFATRTTLDRH